MAMLLLLLPAVRTKVSLGPESASRLGALGVTHASLFRNDDTIGVVLDGWAFDPAVSAGAAADVLAEGGARMLQPLAQLSLAQAQRDWSGDGC